MSAAPARALDRLGALLSVAAAWPRSCCCRSWSSRRTASCPGDPRGSARGAAGCWRAPALPGSCCWHRRGRGGRRATPACAWPRRSSASSRWRSPWPPPATRSRPPGNKVVRVAPGAAFWVLLVCLGLHGHGCDHAPAPRPAGCGCCSWRLFLAVAVLGARARHLRSPLGHARVRGERRALRARAAPARVAGARLARRRGAGGPAARHPLPPRAAAARRHPGHAQRDPDHPGDRAVRHPHGAAGRAGRRRAAGRERSASAASAPRRRPSRCSCIRCCRSSPTPWSGLQARVARGGRGGARHGHDRLAGADAASSCRWRCR